MHVTNKIKAIFWFTLALQLSGCATPLSPIEVSEQFWRAVQNKDAVTIQKLAVSSSFTAAKPVEGLPPIENFTLGRTIIDGKQATVETTIILRSDKPHTIPLETKLIQEKGQWKVVYGDTIPPLTDGGPLSEALGNIKELLNKSAEELQRALPAIQRELKGIEEGLREQLPELRKHMEGVAKEVEKILKQLEKGSEPEAE